MLIRKTKNPGGMGSTCFVWYIVVEGPESKCSECGAEFQEGDLILCEYKTTISPDRNLKKGLMYNYTGNTYCVKCAPEKKKYGMWGVVERVVNND